MPVEVLHEHPRRYRVLLRLLPLGVIVTVTAFAIGAWAVTQAILHNRAVTRELRVQNTRQQATIRLLCDDLYIVDGLTTASIVAVQIQYRDDLKTRPKTAAADLEFLRQFETYHQQLIDQLTNRESPCVRS
jgi:hypothetical protein